MNMPFDGQKVLFIKQGWERVESGYFKNDTFWTWDQQGKNKPGLPSHQVKTWWSAKSILTLPIGE